MTEALQSSIEERSKTTLTNPCLRCVSTIGIIGMVALFIIGCCAAGDVHFDHTSLIWTSIALTGGMAIGSTLIITHLKGITPSQVKLDVFKVFLLAASIITVTVFAYYGKLSHVRLGWGIAGSLLALPLLSTCFNPIERKLCQQKDTLGF